MSTEIVTKRGDDGKTDMASGERVRKNSPVIEAIGTLDELNAALGLAKVHLKQASAQEKTNDICLILGHLQRSLFVLAADLSTTAKTAREQPAFKMVTEEVVQQLENRCGKLEAEITLTDFVVYGTTPPAAHLDMARAVCRRAERRVLDCKSPNKNNICRYLNRLSDFLFLLARKLESRPEYR